MTASTQITADHLDTDQLVDVLPRWFRFADINPISGQSYAGSWFEDLPPFALCEVPVVGPVWNDLVTTGQVARVLDPFRWVCLDEVHDTAIRRAGLRSPSGACPDCWGTLVTTDSDASCTGTLGAPMWCTCFEQVGATLGKLA